MSKIDDAARCCVSHPSSRFQRDSIVINITLPTTTVVGYTYDLDSAQSHGPRTYAATRIAFRTIDIDSVLRVYRSVCDDPIAGR